MLMISRADSANQCGFTLLELLAVILIIAVLLAALLPASVKVIENGRRAKCAGNLKAIGSMIATWTADNSGQITPSSSSYTWPTLLANSAMGQALSPARRFDVFYCPTLSSAGCNGNSAPTAGYWSNYSVNEQVMGTGSASYPIRRLLEFSKPSRTGVAWDSCIYPTGAPNRSALPNTYYHVQAGNANQAVGWAHNSSDPLLRRHGFANVLFLDWHVETQGDPGDNNYLDIARRGTLIWE